VEHEKLDRTEISTIRWTNEFTVKERHEKLKKLLRLNQSACWLVKARSR